MEFLCIIVDANTSATLKEYELATNNEPFAYWKARQLYKADPKFNPDAEWTVDCLQV